MKGNRIPVRKGGKGGKGQLFGEGKKKDRMAAEAT